ncbi:uncharacterized protein LOC131253624 isoform X2 [Magnolia sinica]|uniref:uncharacterized protein LOC131253624 isoform X2 n=1 Tax=Magnolia sinica TaxID=86752 RepID=UPI002657DE78|nr:uncharacterized protein LOC131253624 isoform X2 [Magnolia sinica]
MGRRKQRRPIKSGGMIDNFNATENSDGGRLENIECSKPVDANERGNIVDSSKPFFVEVDRSYWDSAEHFDIAEVVLTDVSFADGFSDYKLIEDCYRELNFSLRFRLSPLENHSFRLGHWPVISAGDIFLEFLLENCQAEQKKTTNVIFSGSFDGPDEGVSGLVHLVSQKLLTVRPSSEVSLSENGLPFRMRVEILNSAFDACGSLLENIRQPWKKSMMNVMSWLRPEVTNQEAKYGFSKLTIEGLDEYSEIADNFGSRKRARFDAAGFYEAIKPSKGEPMLEDELPDLLPQLRPYQRRASYWMLQRERGTLEAPSKRNQDQFFSPLCVPMDFLDLHSRMFYNPFSGNVSLHPESCSSYVPGGILADEMGLGKTVELLACIFAHRKSSSEDGLLSDKEIRDSEILRSNIRRVKRERVECICGAVTESPKYRGLWVQCDICDAWQHAHCVGYSPRRKSSGSRRVSEGKGRKKDQSIKSRNHSKKNGATNIVLMDGNYICSLCCELIEATSSTITTGATLIVCPGPILQQWHAEIIRHTRPGSLRTFVYEGVRNLNPSTTSRMDMNELASADIVLTTYEVLKEDLSHDSDRHDGDRRFMRFQKRYPVVPTPLTRIFWWRICLDEAQMVESNAAAATEMAMRLHAQHRWCITGTPIQRRLDDIHGLLRFLGASPFDVYRWWADVIRDPYERRDAGAMEFTHKYFKQIMWRSSKLHVSDELQLPPQEERLSWLAFSPIEAHFYQRQHETCVSCAHEVIESIKDDIHKRDVQSGSDGSSDPFLGHNEASKLMHSLLKLRQACCHPQVGSSGVRSLQQAPMTMEEILEVLVGKAKIEGEEALRRVVVALNGLAGIAALEQDVPRAVSLYREALALAEEYSDDFRLDPLLNLHIHHNLSELLAISSEHSQQSPLGGHFFQNPEEKNNEFYLRNGFDHHVEKKRKISRDSSSDLIFDDGHLERDEKLPSFNLDEKTICVNGDAGVELDVQPQVSSRSFRDGGLRKECENIKQKYLSVFISKLSSAQQEFTNSYMQVCDAFTEFKGQHATWWLHALDLIEQDDSSNELMRKIDEAVSVAVNNSKSSRLASRLRSISGLKYFIQTGLDALESSRQELLERLLEIDQTMGKPREEDIERVRYCPSCQDNSEGPICIHCELNELFQIYEARLFRLKNGDSGGMIASAEEAVDLQKKKFALNRFFGALSQANRSSTVPDISKEENKRQRDVRANVVVSRSPSELEVILGVLKSYSRALLGREGMSSATKQLLLFESIRKEYVQARLLAAAQAQILRAHDEIKMATSRLRLRKTEDDTSAIDAFSSEELIVASVQFSSDKFLSMSSLSRIKGQLRYLKGLVLSNQKNEVDGPSVSSVPQDTTNFAAASNPTTVECTGKSDDEACPICHENLSNHKMVLQCGHVMCCKCLVVMTEKMKVQNGKSKSQGKWVMCPTCRQRTDFGNIAYVDDRQNKAGDDGIPNVFEGHDMPEISIRVKGSYGTKIEAVTRTLLWIKSTDPEAKVLVFSSWNDVLDVLGHALDANNITYVRMKGGRL